MELGLIAERQGLHDRVLESIYIGGGTPSVFSPAAIGGIISSIGNAFHYCGNIEITMEAKPGTFKTKKPQGGKEGGGRTFRNRGSGAD